MPCSNGQVVSKATPELVDKIKQAKQVVVVDQDGNIQRTINTEDMNVHAFTTKDLKMLLNLMLTLFAVEQIRKELEKLKNKLNEEIRGFWKKLENTQNEKAEKHLKIHYKEAGEKLLEEMNQNIKNLLLFVKSQYKNELNSINNRIDKKIIIKSESIKNLQYSYSREI